MKLKKIILMSIAIQLTSLIHAVTTQEIINATNSLKSAQETVAAAVGPSNITPIPAPQFTTNITPIPAPTFTSKQASDFPGLDDYVADIAPNPITAPAYTLSDEAPTPINAPTGYQALDTSPAPIKAPQFIPDIAPIPIKAPVYVNSFRDVAIKNKEINDKAKLAQEGLIDAQHNAREIAIVNKWEYQKNDQSPLPIAAPRLNSIGVCGIAIEQEIGKVLAKYNNNSTVALKVNLRVDGALSNTEIVPGACFAWLLTPNSVVNINIQDSTIPTGSMNSTHQATLMDAGTKSYNFTLDANSKPIISLAS